MAHGVVCGVCFGVSHHLGDVEGNRVGFESRFL
jgi:hypothetical protein